MSARRASGKRSPGLRKRSPGFGRRMILRPGGPVFLSRGRKPTDYKRAE